MRGSSVKGESVWQAGVCEGSNQAARAVVCGQGVCKNLTKGGVKTACGPQMVVVWGGV